MTNQIQTKKSQNSLAELLSSNKFQNQLKMALPSLLTPDRFTRIVLTEMRKTPKLAKAEPASFFACILQCAQLGLEPGGNLGYAYLIPFDNKRSGTTECNVILGYRGLLSLARRSGQITSISAHCIYENDLFEFEYGLDEKLKHIPAREDRGDFIGVYALAKFKDGAYQFEVMFKKQIMAIMNESAGVKAKRSPWLNPNYFDEMVRKTALRRLCKYLPLTVETQKAITIDESADIGKQDLSEINMENVIDVTEFDQEENIDSVKKGVEGMKDAL
ncbi:MAG: recombinase RecT [Candidatus Bathyarchaeia archaeon]